MSWLYHADLMATLALLLSGLGTGRLIWNLRCSDVDLRQYAQSTRWVVSLLARLSSLPGAIAANSQAGRAYHASLGYRPRRWIDLPNGFDLVEWRPDAADRAAVRAEWSLDDATLAIGMIARVDPSKDHATLFEAAVQVRASRKDVRVVLIGRGTDRLALPAVLDDLVLVLGERRDVGRLVRGLDMAVLSSLTEGFPNVVGEAMASGVPCVVTDTGDSAQIVGDTGMVVPSRSAEALAGAILKLAGESAASRRQRGEAARRRIAGHFGLERALQLYWSAWLSVAAASQPRSGQGP